MIPLSLYLSGFLSYRNPVEVDLTQIELACIAGPNGAGKSSLLDAITWSLFGQARKKDDSVINSQSQTAQVVLDFAYENNIYRVARTKPREKTTTLEFHILQDSLENKADSSIAVKRGYSTDQQWKPLTERSLRETETKIVDILRMDYETFVNASFFLQGKADQFTQQRPGDRKRILSNILGLEIWEDYKKRALESRRQIEAEIDVLDGRLQEILAELSEEASRVQRLSDITLQLESLGKQRAAQQLTLETIRQTQSLLNEQHRLVENQERQVQSGENRCASLQARLSTRRKEQETYTNVVGRESEIREGYATYQDLQNQLAKMDQIAVKFREQERQREQPRLEIQAEQARLEQEQKTLWIRKEQMQLVHSEIQDLEEKLKQVNADLSLLSTQLQERDKLLESLDTARQERQEIVAANTQLKQEMNQIKERLVKVESVSGAECPFCGQAINPEDQHKLIDSLSSQGTALGDQYRQNIRIIQELDEQVQAFDNKIVALKKVEEDVRRLSQEEARISTRLDALQLARQEWETISGPRLSEVERCLLDGDFAYSARSKLTVIDEQLQRIGYDVSKHDDLRQNVVNLQSVEHDFHKLENAQAVLAQMQKELTDLQNQFDREVSELEKFRLEYQQAAQKLGDLIEKAPDLDQAEQQLRLFQEQENHLRFEAGIAKQRVDVLDQQRERKKLFEVQREEYALKVRQYKQLERAFSKDGVPALLIEQALPEIEAKANDILFRLSDGRMSVRFITQAAYKDKKRDDLRETLDIQISDGNGQRDYEMFSGGEAFRVNFAIRLALSEILAKRAGARLQTLVIDEGFGSQDALGRQRLVEAINLVKQDFAKVLVITHIEELKDFFPNRIEVDKTQYGSTVQVF